MMYEGFGKKRLRDAGRRSGRIRQGAGGFPGAAGCAGRTLRRAPLVPIGRSAMPGRFRLWLVCSKAHFITDPTPKSWLGDYEERITDLHGAVFHRRHARLAEENWLADDALPESLSATARLPGEAPITPWRPPASAPPWREKNSTRWTTAMARCRCAARNVSTSLASMSRTRSCVAAASIKSL